MITRFLHAFWFLLLVASAPAQSGIPGAKPPDRVFRAGAAVIDITPPLGISINGYFTDRKATNIHDRLHARALVLDDVYTRLAIVVCDSCMIPREVMDAAKMQIEHTLKLPADRVMISATHTHSGPACVSLLQSDADTNYQKFLAERIFESVQLAVTNLEPAKIAWGVGKEPNQVFNRRWHMKPGTVPTDPFGRTNDIIKMNPVPGSPDLVEPAGPIDPEVSIIALQSPDGKRIALLANYSLHYVGTSQSKDISADYFGAFCNRIQELLGADRKEKPFVALMSNGTSGDINNTNFRQPRQKQPPYEQINRVADAVAREVHRAYGKLEFRDWVPIGSAQKEIKLGVRLPPEADIKRAEAVLAKAKGRALNGYEEIYARETMFLKDYPKEVPLLIQAFRIGDLGIAAIPCEVFVEIGLEIKAKSPFKPTFTIELANGYNGYLPTPAQHKLGGYETWRARSSYLEVDAAPIIVNTVMELFSRWR